jgi:hypothetical protein
METKTPPILSEIKFQVKGAYVNVQVVGERIDSRMCEDMIAMIRAQKATLDGDIIAHDETT